MINISETNRAKWNTSTGFKTVTIEFPEDEIEISNGDIIRESLDLEEAIEKEQNLTFTGCIASRLSFEIADIVQDLRGHLVTAQIRIDSETAIPLFYGYIDSQDNLSHQDVITRFEAYDPLVSKINEVDVTAWYNGLSFPLSVKAFRDSFFTALDIPQEEALLINDSLIINEKTITAETITGGQIVKFICQLNAVFGQFDREGTFRYIALAPMTKGLYPAVDLYPAQDLYPSRENANIDASSIYSSIQYEPFTVDSIEKVKIIDSDGTVGGSFGTGANVYTIHDNPLAWAVNMDEAAQNILVNITNLDFTPSETALAGLPYMECGDAVFINTMKNIVRSYILSRHLSGIQAISDQFSCQSEKDQPVYRETAKTETSRNSDNIEKNEQAIEETHNYVDTSVEAEAARSDAFTNNAVADEAVRVNNLIAQKIQAEEIRTNNLVATKIEAEEIRANNFTVQKVNAEAIRTNELVATKIEAEEIRANSFTVQKVNAEEVRANNLITQKIQAEEIRANSFTTQKIQAEETRVNQMVANDIYAEATRTNNLLAEKADLTYVNGNFATFNYLNTNYLSAQSISSSYATISRVDSISARVQTLEANSITTQYLSSNNVTVGGLLCYGHDGKGLICNSYITINGKTWNGSVATVKDVNNISVVVPII